LIDLRLSSPALIAILFWTGCQPAHQGSLGNQAAAIQALREVELAEERAWISKDLEKAVSFYASDAVAMNPNVPALRGKDQIRASMKAEFDDPSAAPQYQITAVDVAESGELGYTAGTYTFTSTSPATKTLATDRGKWVTIRKQDADGNWKIVQDIVNSDLPSDGKR
jgi:uncharacterized protein (TIGR02246 family)